MGLSTAWEKLYRAVATLATADAPLKERLASAFRRLSSILCLTVVTALPRVVNRTWH
jgi:hypothetical protein